MATKSKFFCVATEGGTTDGRTILREWIQQMADSYDPKKYAARVWLEHIRGLLPDGPFKAYGDVLAVEAREKDDGKLGLFVQIEPTEDLIAMNKARQKIYTSMEINQDFSDSGKAYLVGLAVTDSPASLGTDMLTFTQNNPAGSALTERKQHKDNLFSEGVEVELEFVTEDEKPSFSERLLSFRKKFKAQVAKTDDEVEQLLEVVEEVASFTQRNAEQQQAINQQTVESTQALKTDLNELTKQFNAFKDAVEQQDVSDDNRPPATGGNSDMLTDC